MYFYFIAPVPGGNNSNTNSNNDLHYHITNDSSYYQYSPKYGAYVHEWISSDGVNHIQSHDGSIRESYNPFTGEYEAYSPKYGYEHKYI